jgi:hypothetical protein
MADGAVRFLSDKTDEQALKQILERADGQPAAPLDHSRH